MDYEPIDPRNFPAPPRTWRTRLVGGGLVVVGLLLLVSLLSYRIDEMAWSYLNPLGAEKAAGVPCTNLLGAVGLYIAGLLYCLLGAAAPYGALLTGMIGSGMLIWPRTRRLRQWICMAIMLVSVCIALAVQGEILTEWAARLSLRGPGGSLGYLLGACIAAPLMGEIYALVLAVAVHAVALIYFAGLTPGIIIFRAWDDICLLYHTYGERRRRKREQQALNAQLWKQTDAATQDKRSVSAASAPEPSPMQQGSGLPQQMPLPMPTRSLPASSRVFTSAQTLRQAQPAPSQAVQTHVALTPATQAPAVQAPAAQAPIPPRRRPTINPQTEAAEDPDTPRSPHSPLPPLPRKPQPKPHQAPPLRSRVEKPLPLGQGDNLFDLMDDVDETIVRSSFTGQAPKTAAIPGGQLTISERLQSAANRHMGIEEEPKPAPKPHPQPQQHPQAQPSSRPKPAHVLPEKKPCELPDDDYPFPPYELLNYTPPSPEVARAAQHEALEVQQCLIDTFGNFNIAVEPGDITRGPSLTRYEFYPPKGLRLNRIANLGNDLMLATQTKSVNILAPIPGKNTVGIELENSTKESVYLRELLESPAFHNPKLKIPVALGKNVYGEPVIGDLAAMPHALVAGTTGSGKSVCINSMILSMLYKFRPDELRLVLVDPKVVEMQPYKKLPHLACPVVTNPARVIGALRWAVNEMEHRYSMFSKIGVRNFEDFNNRPEGFVPEPEEEELPEEDVPINYAAIDAMVSEIERQAEDEIELGPETQDELDLEDDNNIPDKLPYIVIIIDELADLMMVVKEDLENYIARLTQKARAAGIHLVAATQTPRSNVVTGLIKANIPCRIALKVASPLDSRIILDTNGAENLLGKGDLLFLPPGGITKLTRAQGAWVSDAEIASIIKFCAAHAKQKFDQSVTAAMNNADSSGSGGPGSDGENGRLSGSKSGSDENDELYTRCVNLVVTERKASTSLLQRRFSIGYGRAAKIMDMMEERGVISPPQGATRAREVLVEAPE